MLSVYTNKISKLYYDNYQFFFSKPNVVGIGYGFKFIKKINTFEPCIQVFVEKKVSKNCLPNKGIIPTLFNSIKTDVIESGRFTSGNIYPSNRLLTSNRANDYTGRVRPIQPGWSISIDPSMYFHTADYELTGTFGYIATDNKQVTPTFCLLSVNNTFADWNNYPIGGEIIQPAPEYGGKSPEDVVGKLLRYKPLAFKVLNSPPPPLSEMNIIDTSVASFVVTPPVQLINPNIPPNNVIPKGITLPELGMDVNWTGCLRGHQTGTILSVNVILKADYLSLCYGNRQCWFKDVSISTGRFTSTDVGALVYNNDKNALGLMFIKSSTDAQVALCHMTNIQSILDVTLLTHS